MRWGEGLFETMRAEKGRIALLQRHLARLHESAHALGLAPMPAAGEIERAVGAVLAAAPPGPGRVRLSATPRPTLLVEWVPEEPLPPGPPALRAISLAGAWSPGDAFARHKSLSYGRLRAAARRAEAAGADHALLLDDAGRLGEAAVASVVVAAGGALATAPADGLLPGIARAVVMEGVPVRERALAEDDWRAADELVVVNAVRGAAALVEVDGTPVGDGRPGPAAARLHAILREALGAG